MHATPSQIEICNRALQWLGVGTITSLADGSEQAIALTRVWDAALASELRAHPWSFAIKRVQVAADVAVPAFGFAHQYSFPAGCVRVLLPSAETHDWKIEGNKILSDSAGPLDVRYVAFPHEIGTLDPAFAEALSGRIAMNLCEAFTQSSNKLGAMMQVYETAVRMARRAGAFEQRSGEPPEDDWILIRR